MWDLFSRILPPISPHVPLVSLSTTVLIPSYSGFNSLGARGVLSQGTRGLVPDYEGINGGVREGRREYEGIGGFQCRGNRSHSLTPRLARPNTYYPGSTSTSHLGKYHHIYLFVSRHHSMFWGDAIDNLRVVNLKQKAWLQSIGVSLFGD